MARRGEVFSDRIYELATPNGPWTIAPLRLPHATAYPATATTSDAIYVAGGANDGGCLRTGCVIEARRSAGRRVAGDAAGAEGVTRLSVRGLQELPAPVGYGAAAVVDGRLFVIGGLRGPNDRRALAEVWSIDVFDRAAAWRREPDLPGGGVFIPSAAAGDGVVYAFSGMGFSADGAMVPSRRAARFVLARRQWETLPELSEARAGAASPCARLPDGKFLVAGGYAEVFAGPPREHPGFNAGTLLFDPKAEAWSAGPPLPVASVSDRDVTTDPGPLPMVGAPSVAWRDQVIILGGEVRPGVRTPAVLALPLGGSW